MGCMLLRSVRFLGLALLALVLVAPVILAEGMMKIGEIKGSAFEVNAPSLTMNQRTGWAHADGGVLIRYGHQTLSADKLKVNTKSGDVVAEGNVLLSRDGEIVARGPTLTYNFLTGEGAAETFKLKLGDIVVLGDEGRRSPDGVYRLDDVSVTTCTHGPARWHYHIEANHVNATPGKSVHAWNGWLYLGKVPIMYVPYWYRNLDGDFGLTVEPGYESRHGAMLFFSYHWLFDKGVRAITHLDLRQKRGIGGGQDFSWADDQLGTGRLRLYILNDQKDLDDEGHADEIDEQRGRVKFEHSIALSDVDTVRVRAQWLSDVSVREDFFEREYRQSRQPDNALSWNRWGEIVSLGLVNRFRINDFYETVERLPEVWLSVNSIDIGGQGLFYESQNELSNLKRVFSELENPVSEEYDVTRLDTLHALTFPGKIDFLNLTPSASARVTYYSETLAPVETRIPATIGEEGVRLPAATNTTYETVGSDVRLVTQLGLETSFKAYKVWRTGAVARRHVVEPYARYRLQPEPNLTPEALYDFDEVDTLDEEHWVRVGVRNKLQKKSDDRSTTVADVDLYANALFATDEDEDTLDAFGMRTRLRPVGWMSIDSDALYSASRGELEDFNTRVRFNQEVMGAAVEYLYRNDDDSNMTSLVEGQATLRPNSVWAFNVFGRYEFEQGRLEEQGAYVQYALDCLTFRLTGRVQPGYERSDGTEADDDYKLSLNVWINAFQKVGS